MNFWYCGGANSDTQWYCPPVVGALWKVGVGNQVMSVSVQREPFGDSVLGTHIEAISAIEVFTKRKPIQQIKNIQIRPAVPPFTSPIVETLYQHV